MCMGPCPGSSNTPRSATSRPYNPQTAPKPNYQHRQNLGGGSNNTRANTFGKPRVTFSGRK